MKKNNIYVLGSLNTDLVIYTDRMPEKGETIHGKNFITNAGGKGGNQAVAAGMLGENVTMIGAVGKDYYSKMLLDSLERGNINTKSVKIVHGVPSGTAVIIRTKDDNRIIIDSGANATVDIKDIENEMDASKNDIFITQFEIPLETVKKGLMIAKNKKMITILNPAPAIKFEDEIYKYVDYLVVNQSEANILAGIYPKNKEDAEKIFEVLKPKGIKNLVVTLGEIGSVLVNEYTYFDKAHKIKPVDTTGAGDAFIGALAYGINNQLNDNDKLKICNATSALVCLKEGAQQSMPSLKEVQDFIEGGK